MTPWSDRIAEIPGGGTRSQNYRTFGPKFSLRNRTLTVQRKNSKFHTLTVHLMKRKKPLQCRHILTFYEKVFAFASH